MKANVQKQQSTGKLPAGIMEGTEAFWHNNEKWLIHDGRAIKFCNAPASLQRMIADRFLADKQSISYLKSIGITGFTAGFERWYRCVIGAIDETPDFDSGRFVPDAFNTSCNDYDCPHRGRLCSMATGLKYYEVATISALKGGFTETQTAALLCISVAGLKSRIEKIKEKLGATNMASMMAKAVEFGI